MKLLGPTFSLLIYSSAISLAGADEVLYMGRYYRDVTVESFIGDRVKIRSADGDAEIPWSALPPALQKANAARREGAKKQSLQGESNKQSAEGESNKQTSAPGQVRLRGHVKEILPEGLLVDCPEPMAVGTGTPKALATSEPAAYGTFLLKGHPMAAYLVDNDPINIVGNPAGTFTKEGETFRIYAVAKADAR